MGTTPAPLTLPAYQGACGEPEPVAAHRCISPPAPVDAVVAVAADVGQEDARLARDVGTGVPGVGGREQGGVGHLVDVLDPLVLGGAVGFHAGQALAAQVLQAFGDPLHVVLDRGQHVRV